MSSSRDVPFSFSPDLRLSLGAPDALNVAVRTAFPALFDSSYAPRRASMPVTSERVGPGDAHSPGGYTSSQAEARAWRRAGHRSVRCSCNRPRDCPRDRFICLADDPVSEEDSD